MVFFSLLKIFSQNKFDLKPLYSLNLSRTTHLHNGSLNNYTDLKNILVNNKKEIEYQIGYENFFSCGQLRSKKFEENRNEIHIDFSIKNIKRKGNGITFFIGDLKEDQEGSFYQIGGIFTGLIINFDLHKNSINYNFFNEERLTENLKFQSKNLSSRIYDHEIELKITGGFTKQCIQLKDINGNYVRIGGFEERMPTSKQLIVASKNMGDGISTYIIRSINFYEKIFLSQEIKENKFSYYHFLILGIIIVGVIYILYIRKNK